ncbi:hypothetical protein [Halodesulfovibrio aestuarii]|uniref:Uncharacterized protein n=2 Tax=Halodesulfovibrio aestuarii TaxID=126333 RepID=A0ABV4JRB0_9BACT|nr:hypothetical protein [Halodesulfovibrio aestuarii]
MRFKFIRKAVSMSLVNSLLNKPVDMAQLQKTAQTTMQKKSASGSVVSNLFVDQQTDHSEYLQARRESMVAVDSLLASKKGALTSLIGTQVLATDPNSPDGKASSATLRNRVNAMYTNRKNKKIHKNNDASVEKRNKAEAVQDAVEAALETISEAVSATSTPSVPSVPVSEPVAVKAQSAPVKISIRV